MTVLITGAGLLGTAFAKHALRRGEQVVFYDPAPKHDYIDFRVGIDNVTIAAHDIRDLPALLGVVSETKPDAVVHTAGLIGPQVQRSLSNAFDVNISGARNVAEAVRLSGIPRLVHLSTYGVYDSSIEATQPRSEAHPRGGSRGYGAFKAAIEHVVQAYAAQYDFHLSILRPSHVYGLGHFLGGSVGGAEMQTVLQRALQGGMVEPSEVSGGEYIYDDDVAGAIDLACHYSGSRISIFNIGPGSVYSAEQVFDALQSAVLGGRYRRGQAVPADAFPLDISKARMNLGWLPKYSLRDGLLAYKHEVERYLLSIGKSA